MDVGVRDGESVGKRLGNLVGTRDGAVLGVSLGAIVGLTLGTGVRHKPHMIGQFDPLGPAQNSSTFGYLPQVS